MAEILQQGKLVIEAVIENETFERVIWCRETSVSAPHCFQFPLVRTHYEPYIIRCECGTKLKLHFARNPCKCGHWYNGWGLEEE